MEEVIRDEAGCRVIYDETTPPPGGWTAFAIPAEQEDADSEAVAIGVGPTKREAADRLLADWREQQPPS